MPQTLQPQLFDIVLIKLSYPKMIVVEYRNVGAYSTWGTGLTAHRSDLNAAAHSCDSCNALEAEAENWWGFIRQNGSEFITDVVYEGVRIRSRGNGVVWVSLVN